MSGKRDSGAMKAAQAVRILALAAEDDFEAAKKKYRKLMGQFHPDSAGAEEPEHVRQEYVRRSQEINEAYRVIREVWESGEWERLRSVCLEMTEDSVSGRSRSNASGMWGSGQSRSRYAAESTSWHPYQNGKENEAAFCERNIYCHYSMKTESETPLYYKAARGRYYWNPEEEAFSLFLTSLHHASKELLEQAEEQWMASGGHDRAGTNPRSRREWQEGGGLSSEERFARQARLVQLLAGQFLHPVETLQKLSEPAQTDKSGRPIYHFQAFLGSGPYGTYGKQVAGLKAGDWLFPESFQGSKIMVKTEDGKSLGHLSFSEDWLYFCLIPLLKKRHGQIKMVVRQVQNGRKNGRRQPVADIDLYFRMEAGASWHADSDENLEIAKILNR